MKLTPLTDNSILLEDATDFDLAQTFGCGQCFRFTREESTADGITFTGIAKGRFLRITQQSEHRFILSCTGEEFHSVWYPYFALDTDYSAIKADLITRFGEHSVMPEAIKAGCGIRILRQDPWETLCSFILSQNNNIPRIRSLIDALSAQAGQEVADGIYDFPTPEALAALGEDKLRALRVGFRAPYLMDAAQKAADGRLDFGEISRSDTDRAASLLMQIRGVGPKVAACVLLFGFGKTDAFPIDVWMKRSLERHFPDGLDIASLGSYAGIAQQYLFYYERSLSGVYNEGRAVPTKKHEAPPSPQSQPQ